MPWNLSYGSLLSYFWAAKADHTLHLPPRRLSGDFFPQKGSMYIRPPISFNSKIKCRENVEPSTFSTGSKRGNISSCNLNKPFPDVCRIGQDVDAALNELRDQCARPLLSKEGVDPTRLFSRRNNVYMENMNKLNKLPGVQVSHAELEVAHLHKTHF